MDIPAESAAKQIARVAGDAHSAIAVEDTPRMSRSNICGLAVPSTACTPVTCARNSFAAAASYITLISASVCGKINAASDLQVPREGWESAKGEGVLRDTAARKLRSVKGNHVRLKAASWYPALAASQQRVASAALR